MILDACGQRSNGGKDAEGLARAESREGSGKWEVGRVDRKDGGRETGDNYGEVTHETRALCPKLLASGTRGCADGLRRHLR